MPWTGWVQGHQWHKMMHNQLHFADATGDVIVISAGPDGKVALATGISYARAVLRRLPAVLVSTNPALAGLVATNLLLINAHLNYCGFSGMTVLQWWAIAVLGALVGERYCLAQFGEPYEQYRRRVPRFNLVLGIVRLLRGGGK